MSKLECINPHQVVQVGDAGENRPMKIECDLVVQITLAVRLVMFRSKYKQSMKNTNRFFFVSFYQYFCFSRNRNWGT